MPRNEGYQLCDMEGWLAGKGPLKDEARALWCRFAKRLADPLRGEVWRMACRRAWFSVTNSGITERFDCTLLGENPRVEQGLHRVSHMIEGDILAALVLAGKKDTWKAICRLSAGMMEDVLMYAFCEPHVCSAYLHHCDLLEHQFRGYHVAYIKKHAYNADDILDAIKGDKKCDDEALAYLTDG